MSTKHFGLLRPTQKEIDDFVNDSKQRQGGHLFGDVAARLRGSGEGKLITPFKSCQKFQPDIFGDEPQETGSCTSHSCRDAIDTARAVEIDIQHDPERWVGRTACEPIYAARGHGGGGMSVYRAARFVHQQGFMVRKNYEGVVDLRDYDDMLGARMGGRPYPDSWLEAMQGENMRYLVKAERPEDVRDALANGYGVFRGAFNYEVTSRRDSRGVSQARRGGWGHAQGVIGWDDTLSVFNEPMVVESNSWGAWNAGGHPPWGPLPVGSYLLTLSNWVDMIFSQDEVFIVGDSDGFPAKELPDYGFDSWAS